MFQGGFAGKTCSTLIVPASDEASRESVDGTYVNVGSFYPEDVSTVQEFDVSGNMSDVPVHQLRLQFDTATDFYGRITVYRLDVLGVVL